MLTCPAMNIFYAVAIGLLTVAGAGLAGHLAAKKAWHKWFFWGSGLVIVILICFQAMSQPPPPPTADEIANDVVRKLGQTQNIESPTTATRQRAPNPSGAPHQSTVKSKVLRRKTTENEGEQIAEPAAGFPPSKQEAGGQSAEELWKSSERYQTPALMPLQAHLSVTQSRKTSTRPDAPVETEVVIQTDATFPSLRLLMQCDKPLVDAQPMIGGTNTVAQMAVSRGLVNGHPNFVVYSYGSSVPPFSPANPLVIDVWSKEPVTCSQVRTF